MGVHIMALKPEDIQKKTFNVRMRGYDQEQVKNYLDELYKEFSRINNLLNDYESKLSATNDKLFDYEEKHDSINHSIIVAQDAADRLKEESEIKAAEIIEDAQSKADSIIKEAEDNADDLLKNRVGQARKIENETKELRNQSEVFRNKLRVMVENQLDAVNDDSWNTILDSKNINQVDLTETSKSENELSNLETDNNTPSDDENNDESMNQDDDFGSSPAIDIPDLPDKE